MGAILLIFFIAFLIVGLIGVIVYIFVVRKQYFIKIVTYRKVAGVPVKVGVYTAREVPYGYAGDKLWKVAPAGMLKFKIIKWLPVGKLQSAPFEFSYYIRQDGEWINFILEDLDEKTQRMGIKFIHEDMRLQRLATERLLEQRHMQKSFWDKWKDTIMTIIFFLVIAVSLVIIFYQFSTLVDKINPLVDNLMKSNELTMRICRMNESLSYQGVVPAS